MVSARQASASSGGITLRILSPRPGEALSGGAVHVEYAITGIRLVSPGGRNRPGEGHVHVYLNNEEKRGPFTTYEFSGLRPGTHTVTIEVQQNDHSPVDPPLELSVSFTME